MTRTSPGRSHCDRISEWIHRALTRASRTEAPSRPCRGVAAAIAAISSFRWSISLRYSSAPLSRKITAQFSETLSSSVPACRCFSRAFPATRISSSHANHCLFQLFPKRFSPFRFLICRCLKRRLELAMALEAVLNRHGQGHPPTDRTRTERAPPKLHFLA